MGSKAGILLKSIHYKKCEEVIALLERGGVVVCFMCPEVSYSYDRKWQGKNRTFYITNYDWLLSHREMELGAIQCGKGTNVHYVDSAHPFFEYLNTKPSWSAYVEIANCENWKVLSSVFETHALALTKRVGLGHIVLLPSYYDYHNGELLERCIVKLMGHREPRPQPSWAKTISVPGQQEIISQIADTNDQITALEKKRENLVNGNDKLESWKYLLYEKGKHQLEPVVREALALLGFDVVPQADKDSDGLVVCDYGIALLEVVGSEGTIRVRKVGQLITNIGNYVSEKGGQPKGVLVGNPFCNEPLDNRPPKDNQKQLFAIELLESAEKQDITVLLSTDLYEVICRILNNELSEIEKKSLQERIFKGKGLVRLI